jgi:hypothetical protein
MVTHIAVCGDSFGAGAGLPLETCFEDNFSGVFANHYKLPQRVYARSGCCNFTIYLQIKKIIEQALSDSTYKPFVLVTRTFHERLIFPLDDGTKHINPDLNQVEYKSYNPYCEAGNTRQRDIEFNLLEEPRLITETISNITYYQAGKAPGIARLFSKVHKDKFAAIGSYYTELFDTGVKQVYDNSLYIAAHYELNKYNIPHVMMGPADSIFDDNVNFMFNHWGYYTSKYPDTYGSGHCDKEGNRLVGENVIRHVEKFNLLK